MDNRITNLFKKKSSEVLNVYFTAGHPSLNDTSTIVLNLERSGVDLVEIGMPYSDPMADGETIQNSSQKALKNGMTLSLLFDQIREIRKSSEIPVIIMGYFNQMIQYGEEKFLVEAKEAGVDGLIIPDLPMDVYAEDYEVLFHKYNLSISFLITPETSNLRIQKADRLSNGFIYVVSKSSITGSAKDLSAAQLAYFERIDSLNLETPRLIGFGIHDRATFQMACKYSSGAIIGSAFIRALGKSDGNVKEAVEAFISKIL